MTAQKGRLYLVKVDNGSGTFNTVGGARKVSMSINNEPVDITSADDAGFRTLLAGAGVNSISVTLEGVYLDSDTNGLARIQTLATTNAHTDFQIVKPGATNDGTFEGEFMVATLEHAGEYNGSMTYNIKLESSGEITFTTTA